MKLHHYEVSFDFTTKGTSMRGKKVIQGFSTELAVAQATVRLIATYGSPIIISSVIVKRVQPKTITL